MPVCQAAARFVSRLADRADVWQTPISDVNSVCYANTELRLAAYRVHVNYPNRQAADYLGGEFGNAQYSAIS